MPLKLQLRPKKGRKILGKCEVRLRDERQVAHLRADGGDLAGGGGAALYLSPHPLPQVGRAATRPQNQFICFYLFSQNNRKVYLPAGEFILCWHCRI